MSIRYWRYSDGNVEFDAKKELDGYCRDYGSCASGFRNFVKKIGQQAIKGKLSHRTIPLEKVLRKGLEKVAPEEVRDVLDELQSSEGSKQTPVEVEVRGEPWKEYWVRWKEAGVFEKLLSLLRVLITRRTRTSYVSSAKFTCAGVDLLLWVYFDVDPQIRDTSVTFTKFEVTAL